MNGFLSMIILWSFWGCGNKEEDTAYTTCSSDISFSVYVTFYNETGGDRERTLHLFEKALENYSRDAIHYGDIASEIANFRSGNGKWSEVNR